MMILLFLSSGELISIILVVVLLFLGFKVLESSWSYRISKPHAWEEAVKNKRVHPRLAKIERFYRDRVRFYNFWFQAERLKREQVAGAFAEVGVYQGETARILHLFDPLRPLYLFDTFSGFPEQDVGLERDNDTAKTVDFSGTTAEAVGRFVGESENIKILVGYFPETTAGLPEQKYAFVHLDADLYHPTIEGLRYFYPRLSPGGVIIVHDYNHNWEGVKRAVDEFKLTIPENVIEIADWQGSVMIISNRR